MYVLFLSGRNTLAFFSLEHMVLLSFIRGIASLSILSNASSFPLFQLSKGNSDEQRGRDETSDSRKVVEVVQCKSWCSSAEHRTVSWSKKCAWKNCIGCDACQKSNFLDITAKMSHHSNNWDGDDLRHSFRAGLNRFPASFPDWDGDGFLDYFYNNHYREDFANDFDFGLSRPVYTVETISPSERAYLSIANTTIIDTDEKIMPHDCHGSTFADLDGDGILDLLISVGGDRGLGIGISFDNLLFWGESSFDGASVHLKGGREAARRAKIEGENSRGRFMLVTDANQDGHLDIFPISDVRLDNVLAPTVLHLNNRNRTFGRHLPMQEFTRTILQTDADGDGHAQEYMVFRATCFRDPLYGEHPESHHEFCSTRPEKTTSIYKFDQEEGTMTSISPPYFRHRDDQEYTPWNINSARDAVSGDFDFDQKADQAVLFPEKIVFYYSSDRRAGQLPLYNEDLGQSGSFELKVPCSSKAFAIRAVDIDNDGQTDLVLMCKTPGEVFLLIQSELSPKSWVLDEKQTLKGLQAATGWKPTERDVELACDGKEVAEGYLKYWGIFCGKEPVKFPKPKLHGLQMIDLNNDGLLDAVLSSSIGHQRFFLNQIEGAGQNRFIRFRLKATSSNVHSVGATLIFTSTNAKPQLREISSFGYGNARSGGVDDRLVFGLGLISEPIRLVIHWPTTKSETFDLTNLDERHISNYSNPFVITETGGKHFKSKT